jgi:hypothetical protein
MTYATTFLFISFVAELLLSGYFFLTANEIPKTNNNTSKGKFAALGLMLEGWKKSMFVFVVAILLFIIYYGSLMVTMVDVTNIYGATGTIENTIQTEDWRLGWEFLKIMIGIILIDFAILIWRIMNQTQIMISIFGTAATKRKEWNTN